MSVGKNPGLFIKYGFRRSDVVCFHGDSPILSLPYYLRRGEEFRWLDAVYKFSINESIENYHDTHPFGGHVDLLRLTPYMGTNSRQLIWVPAAWVYRLDLEFYRPKTQTNIRGAL